MEITKLLVIGSGQMGTGIAQTAIQAGLDVTLGDVTLQLAENGKARIAATLKKLADKGKIDAAAVPSLLDRLRTSEGISAAGEADFIIEAATENREIKQRLFADLDKAARPGVILASNTSSISITEIAGQTRRPDKVVGMHFMNPVPLMSLVEVIRGLATTDETLAAVLELARKMGKTPVEIADYPGFAVNRILIPMINEAVYCVMEGVGTPEAIDTVMKLGANHPMGPLALGDLIGLDTVLSIMEVLHRDLGDDKYRPCPLLRKMVRAGYLGKKSGRGFYAY
jgi:3-hydroxybutyryl-CoA dehydrogenase